MEILIGLIVGLILGGISVWLITKSKIQATYERTKNKYSSEYNVLSEQFRQKEQQLSEFKGHIADLNQQKDNLQQRLSVTFSEISVLKSQKEEKEQKITELKTSLEEINSEVINNQRQLSLSIQQSAEAKIQLEQVDNFKADIKQKEEKINQYQEQETKFREKISQLHTQLDQTKEYNLNQISQLNDSFKTANDKINRYEKELISARQKYSEAEAKETHLSSLQDDLDLKTQKLEQVNKEHTNLIRANAELKTELAKERQANQEKLQLLETSQRKLTDAFRVISHEALKNNNKQFIELATGVLDNKQEAISNLISPLNQSLEKFKQQLIETENARLEDKGQISTELKNLANVHSQLQSETVNLTKALAQPTVRGMWGEMQLTKVLEIAGMQKSHDFIEQETTTSESKSYRPDVIIKLPQGKNIIVDSKAACDAYLKAAQAEEQSEQIEYLKKHAQHIRTHIIQLSNKSYWSQIEHTPEFVVMFLPREVFFSAALEQQPDLIEFGIEKKIVIATPTTLISLLKTVEYSWKREKAALNVEEINNLGQELHNRFIYFANNLIDVRKHLNKTVENFNKAIHNLDKQIIPKARDFQNLGGYEKQIERLEEITEISKKSKYETD